MSSQAVLKQQSRPGSVMVCVLVCLAIAMALVTSAVKDALDERRAMRTQHQLRQTELLLNAGIQRAKQQLQATTDYAGETWKLTSDAIAAGESAQVKIDILETDEGLSRDVSVTARLTTGPHTAIQRSYIFSIEL